MGWRGCVFVCEEGKVGGGVRAHRTAPGRGGEFSRMLSASRHRVVRVCVCGGDGVGWKDRALAGCGIGGERVVVGGRARAFLEGLTDYPADATLPLARP